MYAELHVGCILLDGVIPLPISKMSCESGFLMWLLFPCGQFVNFPLDHGWLNLVLSEVLNTFENIMENGAFAQFSIIFSNTYYFKDVKRRYHGVKG